MDHGDRGVALWAGAVALAGLVIAAAPAAAATVSIACGAVGQELDICRSLSEAWAKKTGNEVKVVSTPNSTTERLALYQQLLAAGSGDVDVFEIDVIWPGILGSYFIDLAPYSKGAEKDLFPAIAQNDTRDGKLIAMPIYTDAGLMYYRKDLLAKYGAKPPATWDELTASARTVQDGERKAGHAGLWGIVFQGKAYEGLTCDALEWVSSYGGGTIVSPDGRITVDNPQAVAALGMAAGWMKDLAPQGVLNYSEEETRGVFQSGNAVFMRNWPYAWPLSQGEGSAVKGLVGVVAIPSGPSPDGRHASTLGGWQLAVSKYSAHQAEAADLVMFLTSKQGSKAWALQGGYFPAYPALYEDKDLLAANPFFDELLPSFTSAVARPSTATGAKYNQVSSEFWNTVADALTGKTPAKEGLSALQAKLNRLSRGGKW